MSKRASERRNQTVSVPDMWVVYDHPEDMPHSFVARLWKDGRPTADVIIAPGLDVIRELLGARGLIPLCRNDDDDPVIVESWI